jgi:hypothetical protein
MTVSSACPKQKHEDQEKGMQFASDVDLTAQALLTAGAGLVACAACWQSPVFAACAAAAATAAALLLLVLLLLLLSLRCLP